MAEADRPIQGYPPVQHVSRDLAPVFERDGDARRMSVPVVPQILTDRGSLDLGIAAVIVDMLAGGVALDFVQPDWMVTSDMTLHLGRPVGSGTLAGAMRCLRAGRNNVVVEGELLGEGADGPAVVAQLGFTRIPRRADTPRLEGPPPDRSEFALPDSGFRAHAYDQLGLRTIDAAVGCLELDLVDYQRNSIGAMQGGVVVALAAKAAEALGRSRLDRPVVATDLTAHYLALGKAGPLRSRAGVLRVDGDALVVRVELRDRGQDDRLCTLVTATVRSFGATEGARR